jgi:hypothetical protein
VSYIALRTLEDYLRGLEGASLLRRQV